MESVEVRYEKICTSDGSCTVKIIPLKTVEKEKNKIRVINHHSGGRRLRK